MKNTLREKLNEQLNKLAGNMQESLGSYLFWGEVEVPECLRRELEESEKETDA